MLLEVSVFSVLIIAVLIHSRLINYKTIYRTKYSSSKGKFGLTP
jgi:hypothetical protein